MYTILFYIFLSKHLAANIHKLKVSTVFLMHVQYLNPYFFEIYMQLYEAKITFSQEIFKDLLEVVAF